MHFSLKPTTKYKKAIVSLVVLTALCVFGCAQLGYFFLPFAAAFYAALLIYDRTPKKILSILLAVILFLVNFLFRGLYSLEAVAYAVVGVIIYLASSKKLSKGETAFFMTLALVVLLSVSAIFIAFTAVGKVSASAITEFYTTLYEKSKEQFIEMLMSLTTKTQDGATVFAYNFYEAAALFRELIMLLVPILILVAFLLTGLTLKFFAKTVVKFSGEECGIFSWRFSVSNFIAYFYVAVAIISMLASGDSSIFSIVIISVNTVLAAPFAYIGFTFVYELLKSRGKSSFFSLMIILLLAGLLSSAAIQVLAFIGVYFNIVTNKLLTEQK